MDVRGRIHRRLFGSVRRRRAVGSALLIGSMVGTASFVGMVSAGAAGTNGDQIAFPNTLCVASVNSLNLTQTQDINVQAVVPNDVATSASYDSTIPGGTANLPDNGAGFDISAYQDLNQTYLFRSSSASPPQISATAAQGGATNNGDPVAFNTSFTNEGTTVPITTASWNKDNGGTITYTTASPHGLSATQLIDVSGWPANKDGYNASGAVVHSVPSATTFTFTGRAINISNAVWSGGNITFTTSTPHPFVVGQAVSTVNSAPGGYNQNKDVLSVPSPTQFVIKGPNTDPGAITTKGVVDTLANPGAVGSTLGSVHTLTTVVLSTPNASPGPLVTPDVLVSMAAPNDDATVTSYIAVVTLVATISLGSAVTVCPLPHADPQADGISATLVGAGGPTTSSNPTCRPPDVCATTTTTTTTPAAPTVTNVNPTSGPTGGGTSVTITGTDLTGATDVSFGTTPASFTVDTPTQITATSPAHAPGAVDVTVTTAGGTSGTSANDQFTYVATPTVSSVSPTSGPAGGGTSVMITGADLTGATDVSFGATRGGELHGRQRHADHRDVARARPGAPSTSPSPHRTARAR